MGYSPKMCPAGGSVGDAKSHWKVTFDVVTSNVMLEEDVTRTIFNDDNGNQTFSYRGERFKVKRLRRQPGGRLVLKLLPAHAKKHV